MRLLFAFSLAAVILLSGCIDTPEDKTPAGMSIPIPIQRNYIQDSAINTDKIADSGVATADIATSAVTDVKLGVNAIPNNYTINNSAVSITGTALINATNESKITANRQSLIQITFSGSAKNPDASSVRALVNGVEIPSTINLTANTLNWTSFSLTWVNGSIGSGTHNIWVQANTSAGTLSLLNTTLLVLAYPK